MLEKIGNQKIINFLFGKRLETKTNYKAKPGKILETKKITKSNTKKLEKVHVAARLVAQIRSSGGRFLKVDSDNLCCFIEIGDQMAWKSKLILFCLVFGLFLN